MDGMDESSLVGAPAGTVRERVRDFNRLAGWSVRHAAARVVNGESRD